MLQLNLCNSGRAGCYTGRAMARAAEVISAEAPDLVTLNEICAGDLSALHGVFQTVHPGGGSWPRSRPPATGRAATTPGVATANGSASGC